MLDEILEGVIKSLWDRQRGCSGNVLNCHFDILVQA